MLNTTLYYKCTLSFFDMLVIFLFIAQKGLYKFGVTVYFTILIRQMYFKKQTLHVRDTP